jgi:hypothetical protein
MTRQLPYVAGMPVEFLSDDQAAVYGVFSGPPSAAELDKFFLLDDAAGSWSHAAVAVRIGWVLPCSWARSGSWGRSWLIHWQFRRRFRSTSPAGWISTIRRW